MILNLLLLHISVFGTFAGTSRMKPRHSTWWGLQAAYQLRQSVQTQENLLDWETAIDKTSEIIHRGMLRMEQLHRGFSFHNQWLCGAHEPVFGRRETDMYVSLKEPVKSVRCAAEFSLLIQLINGLFNNSIVWPCIPHPSCHGSF